MRIALYSDIHGKIPPVVDCDLAIVAGDIGPYPRTNSLDLYLVDQLTFLNRAFLPWLSNFKRVVFIAGNHDELFVKAPHLIPIERIARGIGNITYLQDSLVDINGFRIWGTPYTRTYGRPIFMESEDELNERFRKIPQCDIIVSHGPPLGYGDPGREDRDGTPRSHVGSISLLNAIDRVKPQLVVCGHLHSGYGVYHHGDTKIVNAALADDHGLNALINDPIIVDLVDKKQSGT